MRVCVCVCVCVRVCVRTCVCMCVCVCKERDIFICVLMVHMNECVSVHTVYLSL